MLQMLKTDLGITTTAYDLRLQQYLSSAEEQIKTEGATTIDALDPTDQQIIVMYAAWMWRRRDAMSAMPRMLRWMLNNRIMKEKMQ